VVLPRIEGDVAGLLAEAASGALRTTPRFRAEAAVTVVCASEGYPAAPRTGDVIEGLDAAGAVPGVSVYCAGVATGPDGGLVTAGGRVVAVTGMAPTVDEARRAAYEGVHQLSWPGLHRRSDIAAARESRR
jgi:phosphoribosylamine---glycine ligase